MSLIFVPKEIPPNETRVAATPETVKQFVKRGFRVTVESGAGLRSGISDDAFREVGAAVEPDKKASYAAADLVLKYHPPTEQELSQLKEGALVISFLWPFNNEALLKQLNAHKVSSFAMDQIPRISRAQGMDALSSQSNIAGYKAVLMAANALPKLFPLMMTAAGTIKPAKVVIMGAGVAGLQAIATAKRLGAVVEVSDIRPAVKEQVESLGARFIELKSDEALEDKGGYAREVSKEFLQRQQEVVRQHVVAADVVITTALVPGKKAPTLITEDMVRDMRPGTVIVDIAAEQGGNCVCTKANETVEAHGVTIIGQTNLPALLPNDASEVYSRNILAVVSHLYERENAKLQLDFSDEITAGSIVTHAGHTRSARVREFFGITGELPTETPKGDETEETTDATPAAKGDEKAGDKAKDTKNDTSDKEDANDEKAPSASSSEGGSAK